MQTSQSKGYDERLSVIEDTLQELLQRTARNPTGSPGSSEAATAAGVAHRINGGGPRTIEVAHSIDSGLLHHEDSSVDGMAAVTAPAGIETDFFGTYTDAWFPVSVDIRKGPSSNIAFMQGVSRAASTLLNAPGVHEQSASGTYPLVSRAQSPAQTSPQSVISESHPVNPFTVPATTHGLHLLKLYFSDTGLMYPFICRREVIQTYENFSRNHFVGVSSSWLCLFNAIFAFATYISASPTDSATANMKHADVFFRRALCLVSKAGLRFPSITSGMCPGVYGFNQCDGADLKQYKPYFCWHSIARVPSELMKAGCYMALPQELHFN